MKRFSIHSKENEVLNSRKSRWTVIGVDKIEIREVTETGFKYGFDKYHVRVIEKEPED